MNDLPIPEIPHDLLLPIRSLVSAAYILRGSFVQAAEGRPIAKILSQQKKNLLLADKVLDRWVEHLGLHQEDASENIDDCR